MRCTIYTVLFLLVLVAGCGEKQETVYVREIKKVGTLKATATVLIPRPSASEEQIHLALRYALRTQAVGPDLAQYRYDLGRLQPGRIEIGKRERTYSALGPQQAVVRLYFRDKAPSDDQLCAALEHALEKHSDQWAENRHVPDGWDTFESVGLYILIGMVVIVLVFSLFGALVGAAGKSLTPDEVRAKALQYKHEEIALARDYIKMVKGE